MGGRGGALVLAVRGLVVSVPLFDAHSCDMGRGERGEVCVSARSLFVLCEHRFCFGLALGMLLASRRALQQQQEEALQKQKTEFDSAAERHLAFIDELLADKQALTTRADGERIVAGSA